MLNSIYFYLFSTTLHSIFKRQSLSSHHSQLHSMAEHIFALRLGLAARHCLCRTCCCSKLASHFVAAFKISKLTVTEGPRRPLQMQRRRSNIDLMKTDGVGQCLYVLWMMVGLWNASCALHAVLF